MVFWISAFVTLKATSELFFQEISGYTRALWKRTLKSERRLPSGNERCEKDVLLQPVSRAELQRLFYHQMTPAQLRRGNQEKERMF